MSIFPQSPLLSAVSETFCIMEKQRVSDNAGGFNTAWTEGLEFEAALSLDNSPEVRIGEMQGLTEVYTILYPNSISLEYHVVIRRKSDGKTFRITSDGEDMKTPTISAMALRSVSAEKWELTR